MAIWLSATRSAEITCLPTAVWAANLRRIPYIQGLCYRVRVTGERSYPEKLFCLTRKQDSFSYRPHRALQSEQDRNATFQIFRTFRVFELRTLFILTVGTESSAASEERLREHAFRSLFWRKNWLFCLFSAFDSSMQVQGRPSVRRMLTLCANWISSKSWWP